MKTSKFETDNHEEELGETQRYLQFGLGHENYAIHLLSVKEVIPLPETTPLPNSPSHYVGIMNLRGQIISVIDLRSRLKIKSKEEGLEEAVVIVEFDGVGIGVIVDSINSVLNIQSDLVSEVPEVSCQINSKYIQGVYQGGEKLTILLDLENVLNIGEIKKFQKAAA
ncbi:MAG: chemotaxis protein CheW [Bacteriovoracaceae bacterium]